MARLSSGGLHSPGGGKPCSDPRPSLAHSFTQQQPRNCSEKPDITAPLYFPPSPPPHISSIYRALGSFPFSLGTFGDPQSPRQALGDEWWCGDCSPHNPEASLVELLPAASPANSPGCLGRWSCFPRMQPDAVPRPCLG